MYIKHLAFSQNTGGGGNKTIRTSLAYLRPKQGWTDNVKEWTNVSMTDTLKTTEKNGKILSDISATVPPRLEIMLRDKKNIYIYN